MQRQDTVDAEEKETASRNFEQKKESALIAYLSALNCPAAYQIRSVALAKVSLGRRHRCSLSSDTVSCNYNFFFTFWSFKYRRWWRSSDFLQQ